MQPKDKFPFVSIGIPTYNRPGGIQRTLEQLTSQNYNNLEIIVSDNASPDPLVAERIIAFAEKDSRIKYFRQKENNGFIKNFKFVYHKASHPYFMWAADDDEWEPEFIDECMKPLLNSDSKTILSFCHIRKRDPMNGKIIVAKFADNIASNSRYFPLRALKYILFSGGNHAFYGIIKKEVITPWFFAKRFGSDHLALLSILKKGCIHISDKVLFTSTIGGSCFHRENFHKYYDSKIMKICVNLSSTLTWFYEFIRYVTLEQSYTLFEKFYLYFFVILRFLKPRYAMRIAGDILSLLTNPKIWRFIDK